MAKKKDRSSKKAPSVHGADSQQLTAATKVVDPALAALFDSSVCISDGYSVLFTYV